MSSDDDLDLVFKALANGVRRRICDELKLRPLTTSQLCLSFPELDRCTVMQHLSVLERAGLVVSAKKGRERFNYLDAMPIQALHARWIGPYAEQAAGRLLELKRELEAAPLKQKQPAESGLLATPAGHR